MASLETERTPVDTPLWETELSTADLNDPAKGYLVNDKLVIEVCLSLDSPKRNSEMKAKELHKQHQLQLLEYLEQMHKNHALTDMEIEVENEKFPVHKLILAQAPFFRTMLCSQIGEGTQQSHIILPPDNGVTAAAFRTVLVFMYNVRPDALVLPEGDALLEVHTAARFLMLELLESMCTNKFKESLGVEVLVQYGAGCGAAGAAWPRTQHGCSNMRPPSRTPCATTPVSPPWHLLGYLGISPSPHQSC